MRKIAISFIFISICCDKATAQDCYWQQWANYSMAVKLDVSTNRLTGLQTLKYTNDSPDTLKKVFFHLYWNAFRPGSMMDMLSRQMMDQHNSIDLFKDKVADRIGKLKADEIGYEKVSELTMDGVPQKWQTDETILEVFLTRPILPHTTVTFRDKFEAQVPLDILL